MVGGRPAGGRERARSPRVLAARSARECVLRGVGDRSADGARVGRGPRRRRSEVSEHAREDFVASPAESAIASSATDSSALGDFVAVAASVNFVATTWAPRAPRALVALDASSSSSARRPSDDRRRSKCVACGAASSACTPATACAATCT